MSLLLARQAYFFINRKKGARGPWPKYLICPCHLLLFEKGLKINIMAVLKMPATALAATHQSYTLIPGNVYPKNRVQLLTKFLYALIQGACLLLIFISLFQKEIICFCVYRIVVVEHITLVRELCGSRKALSCSLKEGCPRRSLVVFILENLQCHYIFKNLSLYDYSNAAYPYITAYWISIEGLDDGAHTIIMYIMLYLHYYQQH